MAENQDEIIIIEDSDAAAAFDDDSHDLELEEEEQKRNRLLIFGGIGAVLVLIILLIVILLLKSSQPEQLASIEPIEDKLEQNNTAPIEPSKLENMIAKANYLYTNGSKDKALSLYEQIAQFSEAISQYNLGVAQLKNEQYDIALSTFRKAIKNDEKRCVSAINAAVCSIHLKDEKSFKYYLELAKAYLPNEINSPLYSYYYTLINYYDNNYLEALSAIKHTTSDEYPETMKHLSSKINALFGNNYDAIEAMEKEFDIQDSFNIALLYSRVGDLTLAQKNLQESIVDNVQPVRSQLALGLIQLKAGKMEAGAKNIKNVTDMFPEEVYKYYPIKVELKKSLFDPDHAQQQYRNLIQDNKLITFQKIFYFSPYKVFNANQTISYIRKGTANIFIDNVDTAKEYLKKSASSSNVNLGIAKAIKKALSFKIREANSELKKLLKIQPKHSILHYNLALTYAQLGDMSNAYKHFLRSYHLDAKNYLSGIYALMTSQLIHKKNPKLKSIVKDSIAQEPDSEEKELYKALLNINDGIEVSSAEWLGNNYQARPLYLALEVLIGLKIDKRDAAKKAASKLVTMLPHDIVPHMMYIDAYFGNLKKKEYAKTVLNYLKKQTFSFNDLYYGPYITKYLYTQENLITGKLYFLRKQLKRVLETTKEPIQELTATLALASLYDQAYEEAYTLYNQLIDELKVRDAQTLFLGAVASIAAKHHANAIALLELSKMKDGNFLETRYALGLLYLEQQNNQGAAIQLGAIGDKGFTSKYFNFNIDTNKLLFKKQHP